MEDTPVLELRGITKSFTGVLANKDVDLVLHKGEILALLGENGAGKTTLMNVLFGLYKADKGEIYVKGEKIEITGSQDAIRHGLGMVHQHFMLVPVFSVTENVMLGVESIKNGVFLDREDVAKKIKKIGDDFNINVDPKAIIEDLPVGLQQRVEIIKVLYREAEVLILDEPTAVLTPQEAKELFKVIHSLTEQGKSIIFITHKLNEVLEIADRIMVLRHGELVGTVTPKQTSLNSLAEMMVGREVELTLEKPSADIGEIILKVEKISVLDDRELSAVDDLSLEVRAGEILGIAGVQGNGQTELVEALNGLRKIESGLVNFLGVNTTHSSPREIRELGAAHIPEDRQQEGLVLPFSIADNMVLTTYYEPPFAKGINLQHDEIYKAAEKRVELFDVRTPDIFVPVANLSGGNQQKVILAREFSQDIKLLIASQPTRGLDVGSIEYIHQRILDKRADGIAVLLISPELDEIITLSDRIAVMFEGQIVAILRAEDASKEQLGLLMAGVGL